MRVPKVLDNKKNKVVDELKSELRKGSKLSVISAYFTIYAYAELKKELSKIEERYIFTDKQSGKDFDRKAYNTLVGTDKTAPVLRKGDLFVIYSIDRLGRNYTEIIKQWKYITNEIGADIKVLDMPLLDTSSQPNNLDSKFISDLVLQILSYVAQKERENIKVRQAQGIAVAKEQGRHLGRPKAVYPKNWEDIYFRWKNNGITAIEAMTILLLKKNTFYNLVKRYESESKDKLRG